MKTLAFVLVAATLMISCKKSDDTAADPPLTSPGMEAKLDGTPVNYGIPNTEKQQSTDGTETIFISAFTASLVILLNFPTFNSSRFFIFTFSFNVIRIAFFATVFFKKVSINFPLFFWHKPHAT